MKFGDYSRLTADGLVYSTGNRRKKNGTYRFWSPEACFPYYIYTSVDGPRGTHSVRKVTSKSQLAYECTWTEAITIVLDAHARHRRKVQALLRKWSPLAIGDQVTTVNISEGHWDFLLMDRIKAGRELASYIELMLQKLSGLVIMSMYPREGANHDDLQALLADMREGSTSEFCIAGPPRVGALNFILATYPEATSTTSYLHPVQESHHALWRSTNWHPSGWEKKEP